MMTDSELEVRTSPFIRDAWYVAARSDEIGRNLKGKVILGEPIVLYRTIAGRPIALIDACPHRKFPLSKSHLIGDGIHCGYHGYEFDCSGRCITTSAATDVPANAAVKSYPLEERYGHVWIWMGAQDEADQSLIVDSSHMEAGAQIYRSDLFGCHYQALLENLLDFTHLPYIHPDNPGRTSNAAVIPRVRTDGDVLISECVIEHSPVPPAIQRTVGFAKGTIINHEHIIEYHVPSIVFVKQKMQASDGSGEIFSFSSSHFITPQDERNTHYYSTLIANQNDFTPELLARMKVAAETVTAYNKFVLEQQDINYWRLAGQEFDTPAIADRFDRAPLLARNMLKKRATKELALRRAPRPPSDGSWAAREAVESAAQRLMSGG
ncbi:MAG: aromatic ring-hydroxylating dioxygenase subunit alpha [Bradyrhizobium sp.]|nr:aromatic ring-hydroxylating dioxygenase subunit alpha [Bradyrhizobium sp.]